MVPHAVVTLVTLCYYLAEAYCPDDWIHNNDVCYRLSTSPKFFQDSIADCTDQGAQFTDVKNNQSVLDLHTILGGVYNDQIWTGFMFVGNGSTSSIIDTSVRNVTDCTGCNQINFPPNVTSACITANLSSGDFDWLLCKNESRRYVCQKSSDDSNILSVKDIIAIACASFLVLSFVIAMVTTMCRTQKKADDTKIPDDSRRNTKMADGTDVNVVQFPHNVQLL